MISFLLCPYLYKRQTSVDEGVVLSVSRVGIALSIDLLRQERREIGRKASLGTGLGIDWMLACFQGDGNLPEYRDLLKRSLITARAFSP